MLYNTALMSYYTSAVDHLKDELYLLDLRLEIALILFNRTIKSNTQKDLAGLVITEQEIEEILKKNKLSLDDGKSSNAHLIAEINNREFFKPDRDHDWEIQIKQMLLEVNNLEERISNRKNQSILKNIFLPLEIFSKSVSLSHTEYNLLLLCLAPEIDIKYEKLFGYLQDDVTKKSPTIELLLRVLLLNFKERIEVHGSILNSELLNNGVVFCPNTSQPLLSRPLKMSDLALRYFLQPNHNSDKKDIVQSDNFQKYSSQNHNEFDDDCRTEYVNVKSREDFKFFLLSYIDSAILDKRAISTDYLLPIINICGRNDSGRKSLIKSILKQAKRPSPLLVIDFNVLSDLPYAIEEVFNRIQTEACLAQACVFLDNFDQLFLEDVQSKNLQIMKKILGSIKKILKKYIIFISTDNSFRNNYLHQYLESNFTQLLTVEIPELTYLDRIGLWNYFLQKNSYAIPDQQDVIFDISVKFDFTIGQIKNTLNMLVNKKLQKENLPEDGNLSSSILYEVCNEVSSKNLKQYSVQMNNKFTLDDLILPEERKKQLFDIMSYIKHKNEIFYSWGFKHKMGLSDGLNILFTGESGTGKTMTAQILANELNMKIYKIDLALLVSKYIGDTEKNIDRIFREASKNNSLIFFDEADAIFGKRTEIKDSHDRYSNIEVNYLLQKLEEHNEIVVLASNLKHNIDDAFMRRMHFIVEFPFPTELERSRIWKSIFPEPDFYLDKNSIDLEFFSKQFKTSGAMIKNIALSAAFLAASEKSQISMRHLIRATKRELEKKGKPIIKSDFGKYSNWI